MRDEGATVFAELGHAGSQSKVPGNVPIAPSPVRNFISRRDPQEASETDIKAIVAAFGHAARRALEAGFAGIHLHAGHGYLISEFSSPYANRRNDDWGGTPEKRGRFLLAVYDAVRAAAGPDCPVTIKLGMADSLSAGWSRPRASSGPWRSNRRVLMRSRFRSASCM
jgi:2,4-dienoyl-CoA reductase-like NADH-dependent reductase (Old Yellow Enzyme family)